MIDFSKKLRTLKTVVIMKSLIIEIRIYLAELLLHAAMKICPKSTDEFDQISTFLKSYVINRFLK